jgi:putative oxidoreductase
MALPRAVVWLGAVFLAVAFVFAGSLKLAGASAIRWSERFVHWGYPANAHYVVGVLEVVGGLAVLIPRLRRSASLTLGVIMIGALGTHLVHAEFPRVIPPLILGGVAFLMYWSQRRPAGEG